MKTDKINNYTNFGAIRVPTGYSKAGRRASDICHYINREIKTRGHAIYSECDVMFFCNSIDEDKAERILCKNNIDYTRNAIADIADPIVKQEWFLTGDSNILLDWYLKFRK